MGFFCIASYGVKIGTSSVVLDKYVKYLQTHYGSRIVVVFDGYSDYSKIIKAMKQLRRTAALSKSYEEQLNLIKQHIESFPYMKSHYVRKSSKIFVF